MLENENTVVETPEVDYISIINDLKANTVPVEQHEKLKADHLKALNTIIHGGTIEASPEPKPDVGQLRKELYSNNDQAISNLDYWTKTIKLREAIMAEGKPDPFAPQGKNIVATDSDRASAQRVADGIQHCIDVADGDNLVFTNELQRIMADTAPIRRK